MRLHEIVEFAAIAEPSALALICEDTELSFSELWEQITEMAASVRSLIASGDRVALLSETRIEFAVALYAIPLAGGVALLVNTRLTPSEAATVLDDCSPTVVLGSSVEIARCSPEAFQNINRVLSFEELASSAARSGMGTISDADSVSVSPRAQAAIATESADADAELAWIIHTSGTTGQPKGVCLTHRSLLAAVFNTAVARPLRSDEVYCFPFPMFHVASYNLLHCHLRRRPVVLIPQFSARNVLASIEKHSVTACSLAPTMLAMLLESAEIEQFDSSSLRTIAYGASAMSPSLLRRASEVMNCEFAQGYGMTELSGNAVFLGPDHHRRGLDGEPYLLTCAGQTGPGVAIRCDSDGEILVRGDQVMARYWNRPEQTRDAFTSDGWFRTGDIGRIDEDGMLSIVDRKKDIIISGGENISSREVEDLLAGHPWVAEVAVVGVPNNQWGEMVVAAVRVRTPNDLDLGVTEAEPAPTQAELVEWAKARISGFKRPKVIVFRSEFPMNASGKVLKAVLREELREELQQGETP